MSLEDCIFLYFLAGTMVYIVLLINDYDRNAESDAILLLTRFLFWPVWPVKFIIKCLPYIIVAVLNCLIENIIRW